MQDRPDHGSTTQPAAPLLTSERRDRIAILTLNRPDARNSLSMAMLSALHAEIDRLTGDAGVAVVILAARGAAFCAGHDLKEMTAHRADADGGRAFYADTMRRCAAVMRAIVRSPKPFVAAVHATATAAGCQLVATCDLAVASERATFATPGVNIGLFCSTPMVALSRNIPAKRAMEMLLTGETVTASEAAAWGLVNRVVPHDQVLDEALALAGRLAAKSPVTLAIGKEAFYHQREMRLDEAYAYASEVMVRNMMVRDAEEGIQAFLDKREPVWSSR